MSLTTHVLDTTHGCPAAGVRLLLLRLGSDGRGKVAEAVTNDDGRTETPLLEGTAFKAGVYELVFSAGAYFEGLGMDLPEPKFIDEVPVRFGIARTDVRYHVPLLVSPFGYATYRGS